MCAFFIKPMKRMANKNRKRKKPRFIGEIQQRMWQQKNTLENRRER